MSRIEITLKSDLCAASGDGFTSVIDTDVSYDKYGFPVIGGRRLKGCLKEAAEFIGSEKIEEIFGTPGNSTSGALKISNAVIKDYDMLKNEAVSSGLNAEKVISLFTYTRAGTAIRNDTADENTLRFTRVVRQYLPFDTKEELTFTAPAEIDEKYTSEFSDICKALRNIGYKRNRGFGAVQCRFVYEENEKTDVKFDFSNEEEIELTYTVRLKNNVMLPGKTSDETMDYIPGTSVIGFFASEYLKTNSVDEKFDDMFQKNNVRFSNMYISDEKGHEYFPAPVILGKIKGESGAFNIVEYDNPEDKIIKPVKSGYCDFNSNIIKPLTETVYHHSTGNDAMLYTQTSICEGQYFRGTVSGKAEYIKEIAEILKNSEPHFGRSKSAQYSACELIDLKFSKSESKKIKIKKGTRFIALLISDILIPDGSGGYDISAEALKNIIGLGTLECDKNETVKRSALRYRVITGYNTAWNIQKPHIRTIAAGSTLVFTAEEDMELDERITVGAKQNEGYGKVMFCKTDSFRTTSVKTTAVDNKQTETGILLKFIEENQKTEQMRTQAIEFVNSLGKTIESSQVGRYTMMVKKAKDLLELRAMAKNIRSKKSNDFFDFVIKHSEVDTYKNDLWREYLILILTLIKYSNREGK